MTTIPLEELIADPAEVIQRLRETGEEIEFVEDSRLVETIVPEPFADDD